MSRRPIPPAGPREPRDYFGCLLPLSIFALAVALGVWIVKYLIEGAIAQVWS